jgi:hypothetical protein
VAKAEYKQEVSTVSNTEHKQKVILYLNLDIVETPCLYSALTTVGT